MKKLTSLMAVATLIALLVSVSIAPTQSFAADFTTTQTVANVTVGANTQTLATSTVTANVVEVKATRTITVATAPIATNTIAIGGCTATFATTTGGVGAQDLNCNDNAATIRTATTSNDVAKTTTQIASDILALTNVTGVHGALAITASSTSATSAVLTTAGTETSATQITFTDGTGGKIITAAGAGANVTGVIPVAQVFAITPANVEIGDTFNVVVNGTTATYTATAATVANATAGLTAAINASAASTTVTASDQSTAVNVTAKTAGTAFTINTATTTNRAAVAQSVDFTPNLVGNYTYTITLDGTAYAVDETTDPTVQDIVEALVSSLSGNASANCTEDNTKVTCVAKTAGTPFAYSASVAASVHHGGTSSSGSRHGGNSSAGTAANNGTVTANPAPSAIAHANPNAAFNRDLTLGANGDDVMALQAYLNAHGYVIAMTGPGSKGNETMHFGALTKAALMKMQAANGIMPAAGYFGPKTRAWVAAHP